MWRLNPISIATSGYVCGGCPTSLSIASHGYICFAGRPPNRILLAGDGGVSLARRQETELMRIVPLAIAAIEEIENSD